MGVGARGRERLEKWVERQPRTQLKRQATGLKCLPRTPLSRPFSRRKKQGPIDDQGRFTGQGVKGLAFERRWTTPGIHPYDEITWELRTAEIKNESGKTVFEQTDIEVPSFWSQLATNVVVSKYFRGHIGTPQRERSVKQLIDRVVNTIAGVRRDAALHRARRKTSPPSRQS